MHKTASWKCCDSFDGSYESVEMPPQFKHYAKATCKYCNHFIKWLPNPKTLEIVEKYKSKISKLETVIDQLPSYEQAFCKDMKDKKKFTPKQMDYINSMYDKFFN